uniref:G-protein coupled receptors family 2 profile 2 domain-containing protein n=1 Tax=Tetranychus urticae TaxID=32264 RepID=T1KIM2_TETUR
MGSFMEKKNILTIHIESFFLLTILVNLTSVSPISPPLQLNIQPQNERTQRLSLQRGFHQQQQHQQIRHDKQQQNGNEYQQELTKTSNKRQQQFKSSESTKELIEQQEIRERQILLIQEKQRQQKEQLQRLGVNLVCDTHLCSANTEDYGDDNDLNNNVGDNSLQADEPTETKQCSCEPACTKYGDCCLDSEYSKTTLDSKNHGIGKIDGPWRHWQCTTLRLFSHSIHILTISGCSRFWPRKPGDSIQEKCEGTGDADPFLSVPIYSPRSKHNYRNLYCAVCNYDATYAQTWETFTMCVKNDSLGRCSKSFVYFEKPKGVDLHECYPTDYDYCPRTVNSNIGTEDMIKCGLYYAPVKLADGFTAKNEWCAACNNVTIIGSVCPETRPHYERPPVTINSGRHFSLPVILDIDFTAGGLIVGTQERCPPNHVYDPWKRACRVVTCDPDAQLEGDRCVPTADYHSGTTSAFQVCPKISFNPEEYIIFPNGTAYIASRDKKIEPGHYRIDVASLKLSICAHSHVILIGKFSRTHDFLSNIGISISIVSLLAKIILFFCLPGPRRTANIVILFLCISLLLAQSLFLFGINLTSNPLCCQIIGISIHYLFLATFFWMNVLSYDIFCTFSMERLVPQVKISSTRQIISYSFYGWFTPFIVILISTIVDQYAKSSIFAPNYGHKMCWVSNRLALLVFFAAPVAILLITNSVFFAFTATRINKISKIGKLARENVAIRRKTFIIYTKLFLIMGLTWIFGFVAAYGFTY